MFQFQLSNVEFLENFIKFCCFTLTWKYKKFLIRLDWRRIMRNSSQPYQTNSFHKTLLLLRVFSITDSNHHQEQWLDQCSEKSTTTICEGLRQDKKDYEILHSKVPSKQAAGMMIQALECEIFLYKAEEPLTPHSSTSLHVSQHNCTEL